MGVVLVPGRRLYQQTEEDKRGREERGDYGPSREDVVTSVRNATGGDRGMSSRDTTSVLPLLKFGLPVGEGPNFKGPQ